MCNLTDLAPPFPLAGPASIIYLLQTVLSDKSLSLRGSGLGDKHIEYNSQDTTQNTSQIIVENRP